MMRGLAAGVAFSVVYIYSTEYALHALRVNAWWWRPTAFFACCLLAGAFASVVWVCLTARAKR